MDFITRHRQLTCAILAVIMLAFAWAVFFPGDASPRFEPTFGGWYRGDLTGLGTVEAHLKSREGSPVMFLGLLQNGFPLHDKSKNSRTIWLEGNLAQESFLLTNNPSGREPGEPSVAMTFKLSAAGLEGKILVGGNVQSGLLLKPLRRELVFAPPPKGLIIHGRGARMNDSFLIPEMGKAPFDRAVDHWLRDWVFTTYRTDMRENRPAVRDIANAMWTGFHWFSFERNAEWRVCYQDADFISLVCEDYVYAGGAHGNTDIQTANFSWSQGKLEEVELASFFKEPQWREKLLEIVQPDLVRQGASWPSNENIMPALTKDSCTLDSQGVEFIFGAYMVGSYAEGEYHSKVLWKDIQPMLWEYRPGRLPRGKTAR